MGACKTRTTLLLNWFANPYHTPLFAGKELGFYEEEGIQLALLEPNDPSDVTEIVGLGEVDFGLKAMIHTAAAKIKGFDVVSIGTLLDEPPTGFISRPEANIVSFEDLKGKRLGYIGHFGKIIIDDLLSRGGFLPTDYATVKVGMNLTDALKKGRIDAGIGFINFQKVEIEAHDGKAHFLRIDELAGLGCCCFCSIMYIANAEKIQQNPDVAHRLMKATQRSAAYTVENPEEAFQLFCQAKPFLNTELNRKIFYRTLPFFSRGLLNVDRDWDKVGRFARHLNIARPDFDIKNCYTNAYVPTVPFSSIKPICCAV
jgi:ABC-type nitrate/sulfonate/bicarbonate transport system substrate-binding protein